MSTTKKTTDKKLKLKTSMLRDLTPAQTAQVHGGLHSGIAATRYCIR
jgi:hypothetical protein